MNWNLIVGIVLGLELMEENYKWSISSEEYASLLKSLYRQLREKPYPTYTRWKKIFNRAFLDVGWTEGRISRKEIEFFDSYLGVMVPRRKTCYSYMKAMKILCKRRI